MGEQSPLLPVEDKMVQDGRMNGNTAQSPRLPPSTSFTFAVPNSKSSHGQLPQAIAHRGYKAKHPENTMGAFRGAIEVGAHAIETDLHISKDGVIVLSHDATLKRCFGLEDKIIDCEWKFLETLETLKEPREKMPRLRDLLEYLAGPGLEDIWVLLDIKLDNDADEIMRLIASTIQSVTPSPTKPWNQRIVLGMWAAKYIPLSTTYLPHFPTAHIGFSLPYARKFLTSPTLAHDPPTSFNLLQKILVGPFGSSFLRDIKATNPPRSIFVWTVNERKWMKWSIKKKVDGVITDDPKAFLEVCDEWDGGGMGVGVRDYLVVMGIHVLAFFFGWLFWWRNPEVYDVPRKGGVESTRRRGRIAL